MLTVQRLIARCQIVGDDSTHVFMHSVLWIKRH